MSLAQTCVENFSEEYDDAEISVFLSVNPHSCELEEEELAKRVANGETFLVRYLFNDGSILRLSIECGNIAGCEVVLQRRIHPEAQEELRHELSRRGFSDHRLKQINLNPHTVSEFAALADECNFAMGNKKFHAIIRKTRMRIWPEGVETLAQKIEHLRNEKLGIES